MLIIRVLFKIFAIPLFLIVGIAELVFKLLDQCFKLCHRSADAFHHRLRYLVPVRAEMAALSASDWNGSSLLSRACCGSCCHCSAGDSARRYRRIHPLVTWKNRIIWIRGLFRFSGGMVPVFLLIRRRKWQPQD